MKQSIVILFILGTLLTACGGSELDAKKEKVSSLKTEVIDINKQIAELEAEISELDSTYGKITINKILVTAMNVQPEYFEHKVESRGTVKSRTNVTVSAEVPGKIKSVLVKEGDYVKKGDLLFTLDNDIIANNIAELNTNLELATIVAQKQENLFKKNVGTEIQYLQAKNSKESLERKLTTAKSQLSQARVRAPFAGSIDRVDAKVGEMAQPGFPMIRIVNPKDVHISADISERFIGKFKKGDQVEIYFPTQDKKLVSTIASVGQVINLENRTFEMEIALPQTGFDVRPNQVVVLNLIDYATSSALTIPTRLILRDNQGMYIYGLKKAANQTLATKVYIEAGVSYNNKTEIVSGLKLNQLIAVKGYRDLVEGVAVDIKKEATADTTGSVSSN